MGHWKNRWIQTPQRILMDPCIKQAPVWSKWFWIILWPLAYNRLELDSIRKIINFWYTFGWKWRVFVTIWDCRIHVRMTSMTSSVERTDLDFKISVDLVGALSIFHCTPLACLQVLNIHVWIKITAKRLPDESSTTIFCYSVIYSQESHSEGDYQQSVEVHYPGWS